MFEASLTAYIAAAGLMAAPGAANLMRFVSRPSARAWLGRAVGSVMISTAAMSLRTARPVR